MEGHSSTKTTRELKERTLLFTGPGGGVTERGQGGWPERATGPKAHGFIRPVDEVPAFPGLRLDWAIQTKNSRAWSLI